MHFIPFGGYCKYALHNLSMIYCIHFDTFSSLLFVTISETFLQQVVSTIREIHNLDPQPHRHCMLAPRACVPRVTRCSLGKYWSRDFFQKEVIYDS